MNLPVNRLHTQAAALWGGDGALPHVVPKVGIGGAVVLAAVVAVIALAASTRIETATGISTDSSEYGIPAPQLKYFQFGLDIFLFHDSIVIICVYVM